MARIMLLGLVLLNLVALLVGSYRFFVSFADIPLPGIPAGCSHLHHQGMEDMRSYLALGLEWFAGATLINLVAISNLLTRIRREPSTSRI